MSDRRQESYAVRLEAAELARSRNHPIHQANGEEQRYAGDKYFMSFTKGLPHNEDTGLLEDPRDFVEFRRAIDDGFVDSFSDRVRHGARYRVKGGDVVDKIKSTNDQDIEALKDFRQWEAPTAGTVYELQGPDAQAVTMAPAPPLLDKNGQVNSELLFEMAEVYELAILRDQSLNNFENGQTTSEIEASVDRLNALNYIKNLSGYACQGRPRKVDFKTGELTAQTVFRGSSPGVDVGPYLSQFLLIGNTDLNKGGSIGEGKITYGVLQIDQKVAIATPGKDFMTNMPDYVKVQRGIKPADDQQTYGEKNAYAPSVAAPNRPPRRFISTPRDLATYVHFDALYEAYLNACIILLGMGAPFDPAFDHLSGGGVSAGNSKTRRNAAGFALYGGPHILNLVTEVATRALKAVRFQKFNNHIRLRPEALAARIELVRQNLAHDVPSALTRDIGLLRQALEENGPDATNSSGSTLDAVFNSPGEKNYFLPMAFAEGSPMHPAYGAGHATVAGACVTILKAFFDTSAVFVKAFGGGTFKRYADGEEAIAYRAPNLPTPGTGEGAPTGDLESYKPQQFLTLEGELNKLAANISIGRNMAGVHYFSDYYDSLRMGEQIAIGILEEQALTYLTDPCVFSLSTFDGAVVRIGRR